MPLSSHNCFVLRGRGDPYKCLCYFICPLQAHSCFSPGLLTPVLFLPEPPSAYCSPHQTPLKCLRFHFRGWCKRDKSQRHLKSHFPACLCWVGWRGRHSSPDITENILAQVCSIRFSVLSGGPCGCALCSCCCSFRGFSISLSSSLIAVALKLRSTHYKNSPCQEQAGLTACGVACWGKGKIFQCGTLSYKCRRCPLQEEVVERSLEWVEAIR